MNEMVESLVIYVIKLVVMIIAVIIAVIIAIILNEKEKKKNDESD